MLFHLLYPLHVSYGIFNVFRYQTFRGLAAALTALLISFIVGPPLIRRLRKLHIAQPIRSDGPATHMEKAGTPTMGGTLILASLILATLLLADLSERYVWVVLLVTVGFGVIGFADDFLKLRFGNSKGLSGRAKLRWQFAVGLSAGACLYASGFDSTVYFPFAKTLHFDLGPGYVLFAALVMVGTSNAVNLTDGLDGLAIGPVMSTAFTYGIFAYVAGNARLSHYLQIPYVAGVGEVSIFCAALLCAGLGFLWFNAYPAKMFMGDVGSLGLGGALGIVALLTKQELVLPVAGGVFVAEAISVILQVGSFKMRRKRIFRMAPLHHHFEEKGMPEPLIIVRFWIVSVICTLAALSTLKLR